MVKRGAETDVEPSEVSDTSLVKAVIAGSKSTSPAIEVSGRGTHRSVAVFLDAEASMGFAVQKVNNCNKKRKEREIPIEAPSVS